MSIERRAGAELSIAAFGSAMAAAAYEKAKSGGRVLYTGVALRQAPKLMTEMVNNLVRIW